MNLNTISLPWLHKVSPNFLIKQLYHQSCSRMLILSFWILGFGQNWKKKDKRERAYNLWNNGSFQNPTRKILAARTSSFQIWQVKSLCKTEFECIKRMTTTEHEERDFSGFDLEKDSRRTWWIFQLHQNKSLEAIPSIIHQQTKQQCKCESHQSYKCHVSTSETKLSLEQAFYWLQKSRPMTISHSNLHYMLWKKGSNKK